MFFAVFIAGIDTTAHIFSMCLYLLTKYPDYIEILRKEIDENISDFESMNFE
jgi:cytochrome P450